MRVFTYLIVLLIITLGITFSTLNSEPVAINYYIGSATLPLSILLSGTFVSGCILGILASLWFIIKGKIQNRGLKHKLAMAEKEITNLRAIPLRDQ